MVLAGGLQITPLAHSSTVTAERLAPVSASLVNPPGLPSFADLAEAVEPAVVSIHATSFDRPRRGRGNTPPNPFEFFLNPRGPQQEDEGQRSDSGGSGFLVSSDGLVVTNYHVVDGASQLKVTVGDREYPATVKGKDPETDIALLQIESDEPFSYLSLGDSDVLRVGDWVMVIGSPLNLDKTVTIGVVSAKGRSIGLSNNISFENFIQTDAAINFGNSGGPLVNLAGEVVGIATAINYGAENIGFAVPVRTLKQILPQLKDSGSVSRGYLGVTIDNLTYLSAQAFGLDKPQGALVREVTDETPAKEAGLANGDVILKVDELKVGETRDLIEYVASRGPGAKVRLEILRDGKKIEKVVKLGVRPGGSEVAANPEKEEDSGIEWLGIGYRELSPAIRSQHGLPEDLEGVWVTNVAQTSPLFDQGVQPGQIISEVNGRPTPDIESFEAAVKAAAKGSVLRLYVKAFNPRGGDSRGSWAFVQVP
jgi:serine protease Do